MTLFLFLATLFITTPESSEQILKDMYDRYQGKWYRTLTFTQENQFYKADTLSGTSIWYEAISFPSNFRIDIGDLEDGNAAILANDSIYRFKEGKMVNQAYRKNNLTFLGGGMFFLSWKEVLHEFNALNYDLLKGHKTSYEGREVFVVGADDVSEDVNQLWIDLEHLYVVRVITFDGDNKTDGRYGGFEKIGEAWTETEVTFYINDELYQVEYYSDWKTDVVLPEGLFSPLYFGKVHWMNKN